MVAVWPVVPQWSHLGGGTDGGCVAGVTTVVTLRRMDCVVAVWPVLPQWSHLGGWTVWLVLPQWPHL